VHRSAITLATVFATVLLLVLPFFGGAAPSPISDAANADSRGGFLVSLAPAAPTDTDIEAAVAALKQQESVVVIVAAAPAPTADAEHLAQKPVPPPAPPEISKASRASGTEGRRAALAAAGQSCPGNVGGSTGSAPGAVSPGGVQGTTSADLASFASKYNAIRVANCLNPVPLANFRYDSCMESRLAWMAEDPHAVPGNTWGHAGVHSIEPDANGNYYSDIVPSRGCDGNLAGGSGMSAAGAAQRWWDSTAHRNSLYRPSNTGSTAGVCIYFAMTHGDGNNGGEPASFGRAAARWSGC
jgi:hypothetical protein